MTTIHGGWNDSPDAVKLIAAHHDLRDLRQPKHAGCRDEPDVRHLSPADRGRFFRKNAQVPLVSGARITRAAAAARSAAAISDA
jgi:hypothetical protein